MKTEFQVIGWSWDPYLRGFWVGYLNHYRALLGFDWYDGEGYTLHLFYVRFRIN